MKRDGAVAAVGNAGGVEFPGSVLPFILRGVTLFGIDSVVQPYAARVSAWDRLSTLFSPAVYAAWVEEATLDQVPEVAARILKGGVRGRVVIDPRR